MIREINLISPVAIQKKFANSKITSYKDVLRHCSNPKKSQRSCLRRNIFFSYFTCDGFIEVDQRDVPNVSSSTGRYLIFSDSSYIFSILVIEISVLSVAHD